MDTCIHLQTAVFDWSSTLRSWLPTISLIASANERFLSSAISYLYESSQVETLNRGLVSESNFLLKIFSELINGENLFKMKNWNRKSEPVFEEIFRQIVGIEFSVYRSLLLDGSLLLRYLKIFSERLSSIETLLRSAKFAVLTTISLTAVEIEWSCDDKLVLHRLSPRCLSLIANCQMLNSEKWKEIESDFWSAFNSLKLV